MKLGFHEVGRIAYSARAALTSFVNAAGAVEPGALLPWEELPAEDREAVLAAVQDIVMDAAPAVHSANDAVFTAVVQALR